MMKHISSVLLILSGSVYANEQSEAVHREFTSASKQLVESTTLVQSHIKQYCNDPSAVNLELVKSSWVRAIESWNHMQGFERGPAHALEQSWRIQFWPDKKNTTGRKMSALSRSQEKVTAEMIASSSVTVQGLGALEWLFYDTSSPLKNAPSKACELANAISQNLVDSTGEVAKAWETNPWQSTSELHWNKEYITLLSNQLDYSMKKLSRPLAKVGKPRPYFSESWRSNNSLSNLKQNVIAFRAVYLANGRGMAYQLKGSEHAELDQRIQSQISTILETWPESSSLFHLLKTKQGYREVLALYNKFEYLRYLVAEELAAELGVVVGFNSSDGD